ncbi:MAG: hypothetical protein H0U76_20570, partial [Ktedonobacteraceae bacterium]|nr:hypothetical protein [Ktedonobacteraceae bacterium]
MQHFKVSGNSSRGKNVERSVLSLAVRRRQQQADNSIKARECTSPKVATPLKSVIPLVRNRASRDALRMLCALLALAVPFSLSGAAGASSFTPQISSQSPTSGNGSSGNGSNSGTPAPQGSVSTNVQANPGNWRSWGQVAPNYIDCNPCKGVAWSIKYGITSPSLTSNATQFNLSGTKPYGNALFAAGLIGQNSTAIPDANHKLLPTLHNFKYETDVYVKDASVTQALDFDISMFMNGLALVWG